MRCPPLVQLTYSIWPVIPQTWITNCLDIASKRDVLFYIYVTFPTPLRRFVSFPRHQGHYINEQSGDISHFICEGLSCQKTVTIDQNSRKTVLPFDVWLTKTLLIIVTWRLANENTFGNRHLTSDLPKTCGNRHLKSDLPPTELHQAIDWDAWESSFPYLRKLVELRRRGMKNHELCTS